MTADSGGDWHYLGRCLRASRNGRPRSLIHAESGVSEEMIKRYEAGDVNASAPPDKLWQLVNYYRWSPDSIDRVLGGPPATPTIMPPPMPAAVRDRLLATLRDDATLDEEQRAMISTWLTSGR